MPRTTVDIDASVLRQLKALARKQGKSIGRVISELVAKALPSAGEEPAPAFRWVTGPMGARVDLEDKDALYDALE